jgi:hypothetical protein
VASADLLKHLALERPQTAPEAERKAEASRDRAVRAELLGRHDAAGAIAAIARPAEEPQGALAQHLHAVSAAIGVELLLSIGTTEARAALFDLLRTPRHEARALMQRFIRARSGNDALVRTLLDARCEATTLRLALRAVSSRRAAHGSLEIEQTFGTALRALAKLPEVEKAGFADALYDALADAGSESQGALLEWALADPRPQAPAVRALVNRRPTPSLLGPVLARMTPDEAWSTIQDLFASWNDYDALDAAFAHGDSAGLWDSPVEFLERLLAWTSGARDPPSVPSVLAVEGAHGGVAFDVRTTGRTGLWPLFGHKLTTRIVAGRRVASLPQAQTQDVVVGTSALYQVHCWCWNRGAVHNRVRRVTASRSSQRQVGASNASGVSGPTMMGADVPLDSAWVARNTEFLAQLRPGRYVATCTNVSPHQRVSPPFLAEGYVARKPPVDGDDDIDADPEPEAVPHFFALVSPASGGSTEVVLLPSGILPDAAPVAFAWRAPEELVYASFGAAVPVDQPTRIWAVLLQGQAAMERAAARGDSVLVIVLVACAWAGEDERVVRALTEPAL